MITSPEERPVLCGVAHGERQPVDHIDVHVVAVLIQTEKHIDRMIVSVLQCGKVDRIRAFPNLSRACRYFVFYVPGNVLPD